jgi:hypothetical protein
MYENLILPNQSAPFGQLLQNEVAYQREQDRYNQHQDQQSLQQRQQQQQQAEQQRRAEERQNLEFLDRHLDPTKNLSGIQKIDMLVGKKVADLYSKYVSMAGKMNGAEMRFQLQNEFMPVLTASASAKNKYNEELALINAATSKNKNLNKEALMTNALKRIGQEVVTINPDGSYDFKPAEKYNLDVSFTEEALSSPDAWKYALGDGGLVEYLRKGIDEKPVEFFAQNPDGSTKNWEAIPNALLETDAKPDKKGFVKGEPQFKIKAEEWNTVRNGKNESFKMIPSDLFSQHFEGTDDRRLGFLKLWEEFKANKGIKPQNHIEEDKLKRNFAYQLAEQNSLRQPTLKNITQPPRTTVNVSSPEKEAKLAGGKWANKMADVLAGGDINSIREAMSELYAGNGQNRLDDDIAKVRIENGHLVIPHKVFKEGIDVTDQIKNEAYKQVKIPLNDKNAFTKFKGVWQRFMGSDALGERATRNKPAKPSNKKPVYKGLDADGNPIFE